MIRDKRVQKDLLRVLINPFSETVLTGLGCQKLPEKGSFDTK